MGRSVGGTRAQARHVLTGGALTPPPPPPRGPSAPSLPPTAPPRGHLQSRLPSRPYPCRARPGAVPRAGCYHRPHPTRRAARTAVCGRPPPLQRESLTLGPCGPDTDRGGAPEPGKTLGSAGGPGTTSQLRSAAAQNLGQPPWRVTTAVTTSPGGGCSRGGSSLGWHCPQHSGPGAGNPLSPAWALRPQGLPHSSEPHAGLVSAPGPLSGSGH